MTNRKKPFFVYQEKVQLKGRFLETYEKSEKSFVYVKNRLFCLQNFYFSIYDVIWKKLSKAIFEYSKKILSKSCHQDSDKKCENQRFRKKLYVGSQIFIKALLQFEMKLVLASRVELIIQFSGRKSHQKVNFWYLTINQETFCRCEKSFISS